MIYQLVNKKTKILVIATSHIAMGVGAQKDLGGHQTFAQNMTLNFAQKAIGFKLAL